MGRSFLQKRCQKAEVRLRGGQALPEVSTQFSKDGKWIFVCHGKVVEVYSRSTHCVMCTLEHHTAPITGMCLNNRNVMQLMTASLDGQLVLWDFTDGSMLKSVDFGVPLLKFALRPGEEDPSVFFVIKKGLTGVAVVGVSRKVITERCPVTPPDQQLQDAQQFFTAQSARDLCFTYKGEHLVTCTGSGNMLVIYDFSKEHRYSYKCVPAISALACHPSSLCIATGNKRGEIHLWYDFALPDHADTVVTSRLHWHAHSVGDVCFTTDGTYLLSGGEECVLVIWTLKTSSRQFRPRLSAPITKIACAPGDAYFTVSLLSNVIQVLSGLNLEVEGYLGGLRKTWLSSGMKTGLVLRPDSKSVVLNSTPGLLQFFDTNTGAVSEFNVTGLNYVSRTDDKPLVPTTVDHVAFSPSGDWMATVESRDDGQTSPELRLKFWRFFTKWQKYVQNTCVNPPHDKGITDLRFQPSLSQGIKSNPHSGSSRRWNGSEAAPSTLAVTTSLDGKFKMWVLIDNKDEKGGEEEETEVRRKRRRKVASWACRSVGYHQNLPCMSGAFSHDGSLLALNFSKALTVWEPYHCVLRTKFSSSNHDDIFKQVEFGSCSCSHYLLATGTECLHVWDMLTCRLLWRVTLSVPHLVVDPFSSVAAVFVRSDQGGITLYQIDPSMPTPLAVHSVAASHPITGATFIPHTWDSKSRSTFGEGQRSSLYFIDQEQIMYSLETGRDSIPSDSGTELKSLGSRHAKLEEEEGTAQKAFTYIFGGRRKRLNGLHTTSNVATPASCLSSSSLLTPPPHVLPPPSSLCSHFMRQLLPRDAAATTLNIDDGNQTRETGASSDDEGPSRISKKLCHTVLTSKEHNLPTNCSGNQDLSGTNVVTPLGSYCWLVDYFKSNT